MNKQYLMFLLRQHKAAYIFFAVLYIAIALTPFLTNTGSGEPPVGVFSISADMAMVMSILLSYILPVILFSFLHCRRSVDLYLALPLKRKELLISGLGFSFLFSWLCYLVASLLGMGLSGLFLPGLWFRLAVSAALVLVVMTMVNTLFFVIANNLFDGIVMIGAYTMFPLLVMIIIANFGSSMVAGVPYSVYMSGAGNAGYLSPVFLGMRFFSRVIDSFRGLSSIRKADPVLLCLYGLLSGLLLKKEVVERKAERAEQVSDGFFSYPLVINLYALCAMVVLSSSMVSYGSVRGNLIYYLLLLLIYIVAMFVYKRTIQIRMKDLLIFLIGAALTCALALTGWKTRGFGFAENYSLEKGNWLIYSFSEEVHRDNLEEKMDYSDEDYDYQDQIYIEVVVEVPVSDLESSWNMIDILERKRKTAIDNYYNKEETGFPTITLFVNQYDTPQDAASGRNSLATYQYTNINTPLTIEELQELEKGGAKITIYDASNDSTWKLSQYLKKEK